jgi:hypothetical protein
MELVRRVISCRRRVICVIGGTIEVPPLMIATARLRERDSQLELSSCANFGEPCQRARANPQFDFTTYSHQCNPIVTLTVQSIAVDIDALHSTLLSITMVSEKLRAGQEIIDKVEKVAPGMRDLLDEAEKDLRVAQATLACELGFQVCPTCWPPELLASDRKGQLKCPTCGEVELARAAA